MKIIDQYILRRFFINFAILFAVLYCFAIAIDLLINLDRFVDAARTQTGEDAAWLSVLGKLCINVFDFQAPRLFQFYAYLHGLLAVGAMAFTLSQMHRARELVAVMASGVSLYRIAAPFIAGVFVLSLIQLINLEFALPRVAPLLLRGQGEIGKTSFESFPVLFTADGDGHLLQAAMFTPPDVGGRSAQLDGPTILVRDDVGRTTRRITADRGTWSAQQSAWMLEGGRAVDVAPGGGRSFDRELAQSAVDRFETDLSPDALTMRRHGEYASMLSLRQIQQMQRTPDVIDAAGLQRYKYARFAGVLVNLLILGLCLPSFLLREPVPLMAQTLKCAALALPAMLGAAVGMMASLPGVAPAVGVFLPVLILAILVLGRWTFMKT